MTLSSMPKTVDRRPYFEENPDLYLESDRDWAQNNWESIRWLADNHKEIRAILHPEPNAWSYEWRTGVNSNWRSDISTVRPYEGEHIRNIKPLHIRELEI